MKWFYNLKVGAKILSGFIIISAIAGVIGFIGITGIREIDQADTAMYELNTKPLGDIGDVAVAFQRTRVNLRDMTIDKTEQDKMTRVNAIKDLDKEIETNLKEFEASMKAKEVKDEFAILKNAISKFKPIEERIKDLALNNKNDEAVALIRGEGFQLAKNIDDSINKLFDMKIKLAKEKSDENSKLANSTTTINIVITLIGVAFAIVMGIFISRSITNPIKKGLEFSQRLAEGDFTQRVDVDQKDEVGLLADALNRAADDLEKLISEIVVASQNLAQAVEQISSGNQNLSQRTSEQASSLEEIASTIEEATAAINQNTDNSSNANKMANSSSQMAIEGGKLVGDAVASINEINQSSKKIAEIISVINEISFQTNLLALNAAVEAARAGEQGRGFAVVAGEVRNLAQRSGNAAKEISTLISDSVDKIEKGTAMANKSGEALKEIIESVKNVGSIISEIAASSNEQKQGISQINVAITEMDSMTQQNASLVEETASASEEMANQAQELLGMMKRFKINESLQENLYTKKHKELHLKAAEVKRDVLKKDTSKKEKKIAAVDLKDDARKNNLKDTLSSEGFEEF